MLSTLRLADGSNLEYADLGDRDGVPVVYQPGTPSTAGSGVLLAEAAARHGVHLLSVSRPGYGASTSTPAGLASVGRQVVELADALGWGRFGTLGSSGGGPFSLATAAVAPERVTRVVVLGGAGPVPLEDRVEEDSVAEAQQVADQLLSLDADAFVAALRANRPPNERYLDDRPVEAATFFADFRRALDPSAGFARDNEAWGGDWDVELAAITCPVDLIYGEADQMVTIDNGRRLAEAISHATFHVLPGAGHGDTTFGSADLALALFTNPRPAG